MSFKPITYNGKRLTIHKAAIDPDFGGRSIIAWNPWEYVEMLLKSQQENEALFYWEQAKNFFQASRKLPKTSSPLTLYYSFLNATKTLLTIKKKSIVERHGVGGEKVGDKLSLSNEKVKFQRSGILSNLCEYLNESSDDEEYSLKDLLYNLPYVHRAYQLTFKSNQELFIPIRNPKIIRKEHSSESFFCAEIKDKRYTHPQTIGKIPSRYERDVGIKDEFVIREKNRFKWDDDKKEIENNLNRFKNYHTKIRKDVVYIYGPERLWYLKKTNVPGSIDRSSLTITFAIMHRLSELARYQPISLAKHLESKHNWLLSEFINGSRHQFIDEIFAEITGKEFVLPGRR